MPRLSEGAKYQLSSLKRSAVLPFFAACVLLTLLPAHLMPWHRNSSFPVQVKDIEPAVVAAAAGVKVAQVLGEGRGYFKLVDGSSHRSLVAQDGTQVTPLSSSSTLFLPPPPFYISWLSFIMSKQREEEVLSPSWLQMQVLVQSVAPNKPPNR